jgi:hypothetical protein
MELTKYAAAIKNELEMELHKRGSSILEFEQALSSINTGDGVFKIASTTTDILSSIPEYALKGSLAGGAVAGLGLDEMDKSVESMNNALAREREKVNLVRRITHNLKREHGII